MANLKDLIVNGSARILGSIYGNLVGNADTATKLETARTIRTNLGSTSAVGFDGSTNITPGVTGTLPVANGGTGQTSIANIQAGKDADGNVISTTYVKNADMSNYVDLTSNQTISGTKTFSNEVTAASFTGTINGDNYINWGGPNLQQNVSPSDAGCIDDFGHNKAAYWGGLIDIEYTTDGTTWLNYGVNNVQKWQLTTLYGYDVIVGKGTVTYSGGTLTNDNIDKVRARITLHVKDANNSSKFYSQLKKILLNVATCGANGTKVKISVRTLQNYLNNVDTWVDKGTYDVSGWSAWNSIPFDEKIGGYDSQTGYYADIRIELWSTSVGSNTSCAMIKDIRLIGVTNWVVDKVASTGHLYEFDSSKNVFFPADLNVTGTIKQNNSAVAIDSNVVHNTGNETIAGTKTFSSTPAVGTLATNNNSTSAASTAYVQNNLQNYLKQADQGNLLPNFDAMTVLQTVEFDTSDSNYHVICTRTNTDSSDAEINDVLYFRITVTGTNINQVGNYGVIFPGRINCQPFVIANMLPGTSSSAYGGNRYLGYVFPKALNNGYNWEICILNNRNNSARHYKVEVFKTNSKCTWVSGTATTYNSTYQGRGTMDVETRYGYVFNYMYGQVMQSDNATQLNGRLFKFINCTINTAGAALLANQFVYQNGNSLYPATDKTKAIEPGYGIQWNNAAYNSGNSVGWDQIRQKQSITSLTNIPHATLARGNPCYFRCTTDSDGNIYSDNYVNVQMTPGYTWYYVGIAQSSSAIALDTTQSFFITLDDNGNVTHINGKQVSDKVLSGGISNCILEIPQNIKSDLIDISTTGKVTFKSGIKIPMIGSSYTETVLTQDTQKTYQTAFTNSEGLIFYVSNQSFLPFNRIHSGDTQPTVTGNTHLWFDTTNKKVFITTDAGTNWTETTCSFPVAAAKTDSSGKIIEFLKDSNGNDMIFNGAGFIGHHAFVYPNVKVLIPDGFNDDGSLKSISRINNELRITELNQTHNTIFLTNWSGYIYTFTYGGEFDTIEDMPTNGAYCYVKTDNAVSRNNHGTITKNVNITPLVSYSFNGTTVTNFTIRQPVRFTSNEDFTTLSNTVDSNTSAIALKADDSNVVHKTGNETINGTKTFNNGIKHINSFTYWKGSDSSTLYGMAGMSTDVTYRVGLWDNNYYGPGIAFQSNGIYINKGMNPQANEITLNIPTPSEDTTSSTQADTVGARNTKLQNYQLASTAVTHTASTAAGSATNPVYIASNGVATATTYTLSKSVPSDAVFTDTITYRGTHDTSVQYHEGDIVKYNSAFYEALQNNINILPTSNTAYWSKLSNDNTVKYSEKSNNVEYPIGLASEDASGSNYGGYMYFTAQNKPTINASTGVITATGGIVTKTETAGDNSTKAATTAFVQTAISGKADDSGVVHTTTDETIAGNKTFTGITTFSQSSITQYYKSSGYTKGTAPSNDTYLTHREYRDSGNKPVMDEYYYIPKNSNKPTYILRFRNVSSASATGYKDVFAVNYDGTNSTYAIGSTTATAPTPAASDSTSGTNIATTGWVNNPSSSTNVVHRSGGETIAGIKTFTDTLYVQKNSPIIYAKMNNFDVTTNPESSYNARIAAVDKNGTWVAGIYYNVTTSGSKTMDFRVKQKNGHNLQLGLGEKADGTGYTYCVEPTENTTTSTQIDTVGARNTAINAAISGSSNTRRNVGEIIASSIPLTDAGLHLLDGSLISGSGTYSAFVTYMASLVSGHPDLFTTEADWQATYTEYGVCGKFVYDSTNNTIRLPYILGFIEGTLTETDLGDVTEAGLPNHTHAFGRQSTQNNGSFVWNNQNEDYVLGTQAGAIYYNGSGEYNYQSSYDAGASVNESLGNTYTLSTSLAKTDNLASDGVWGNSSSVQPQSIKVYYYIVVANVTKTEIEVDIDEIQTELNNTVKTTDLHEAAVIVETYKNGTDWYRIWSDGWIEQGGRVSISSDTQTTVSLLKSFSDINYTVLITANKSGLQTGGDGNYTIEYLSTTQFIWGNGDDFSGVGIWYACGY